VLVAAMPTKEVGDHERVGRVNDNRRGITPKGEGMHTHYERGSFRAWLRDGRSIEASWGPVGRCFFAFELQEDHLRLGLLGAQLYLPYPGSRHADDVDVNDTRSWGFVFHGDALSLSWGARDVWWDYPWLRWVHVLEQDVGPAEWAEYTWRSRHDAPGIVNHTECTIQVQDVEWRWLHARCPIRRRRRYLAVRFHEEVGEGRGSWKGGTLGCWWEMRADETGLGALRRMERERVFR